MDLKENLDLLCVESDFRIMRKIKEVKFNQHTKATLKAGSESFPCDFS